MSQINRVPQGLQDLLGSINFGDNPGQLGGVVAPTLDLFPFLSVERLFWDFQNIGFSVAGSLTGVTVPQGELWFVDSLASEIFTSGGPAAGDTVTLGVVLTKVINSNATTIGVAHPLARLGKFDVENVPTSREQFNFDYPRLLPILGGQRIVFHASNLIITGGTFNVTNTVRYYKLNV